MKLHVSLICPDFMMTEHIKFKGEPVRLKKRGGKKKGTSAAVDETEK